MTRRLGLTTKEEERIAVTLPHIKGRLLDIGAGKNTLVRRHGNGVGIDVFDWGGGAQIVKDVATLPFENESFDTVTFLASLNHIPERRETLEEAYRLLRSGGQVLITMIGPFLGLIGHQFWWYGGRRHRLESEDELPGMTAKEVWKLCTSAGFERGQRIRFVYGMNNLYIARIPRTAFAAGAGRS